ncbi:DUF4157 domain-containing protein [Algibacter miyuki]|uniref:DUF4157 domain-containing protein n=1 Tax=Algibacter miyuki TaxID=1306933 RepID=A0ABV5GZ86_9FLAO|nr:DUF4157 domain-containing protein [Algibacter miyuki]MDN3666925.1 DUF4157 domain-containing protein [Algibacter miyuki]
MQTHVDKTHENKSQSVANAVSQKQSNSESAFQFVDNRPEAVAQRKLQEVMNNSPQVRQLKVFQEMANNSPLAKQVDQLQAMTDNHSTQNQHPIQKKGNDTGLPDNLKSGIESLSGYSMDDVKVHYNSDKPAQLQAHAYAQGTDIHLASGQERHLPHEAWHVVQQKQGRVKSTMQLKGGVNVNDDTGLEKEADKMGDKALVTQKKVKKTNLFGFGQQSNSVFQRMISLREKKDVLYLSAEEVINRLSHGGRKPIPREHIQQIVAWDNVDRYFKGGLRELQTELKSGYGEEPEEIAPSQFNPKLTVFLDILRENDRGNFEISWVREELKEIQTFLSSYSEYDLAWLIVVGGFTLTELRKINPAYATGIMQRFDLVLSSDKILGDYSILVKDAILGSSGALGELKFIERHASEGIGELTAIPELEIESESGKVTTPDFNINGNLVELKTRDKPFKNSKDLKDWINDRATTANKQMRYSEKGKGLLVIQLKSDQMNKVDETQEGLANYLQDLLSRRFSSLLRIEVLIDGAFYAGGRE